MSEYSEAVKAYNAFNNDNPNVLKVELRGSEDSAYSKEYLLSLGKEDLDDIADEFDLDDEFNSNNYDSSREYANDIWNELEFVMYSNEHDDLEVSNNNSNESEYSKLVRVYDSMDNNSPKVVNNSNVINKIKRKLITNRTNG